MRYEGRIETTDGMTTTGIDTTATTNIFPIEVKVVTIRCWRGPTATIPYDVEKELEAIKNLRFNAELFGKNQGYPYSFFL